MKFVKRIQKALQRLRLSVSILPQKSDGKSNTFHLSIEILLNGIPENAAMPESLPVLSSMINRRLDLMLTRHIKGTRRKFAA